MFGQTPSQVVCLANVTSASRVIEKYVDKVTQAPPVGDELPKESTGQTPILKNGASNSAAFPVELKFVVEQWSRLSAHARASIQKIVRKSKRH
jgi:hypothetical protein